MKKNRKLYRVKNKTRFTISIIVLLVLIIAIACILFLSVKKAIGIGTDGNAVSRIDKIADIASGEIVDKSSEYMVLVNKKHGVKEDYRPDDLISVKAAADGRKPEYQMLRKAAAEAFDELVEAAANDGYTIKITTGYRPYSFQKELYDKTVRENGKAYASKYSAKPGYSEHQTGLAADVSSPSVQYKLLEKYGETPEGKWIAENAHKFGFIIRYKDGTQEITGYEYEPWHIRYVGKIPAGYIYDKQITLEEYLK